MFSSLKLLAVLTVVGGLTLGYHRHRNPPGVWVVTQHLSDGTVRSFNSFEEPRRVGGVLKVQDADGNVSLLAGEVTVRRLRSPQED